ncbi:unnamed protein product [Sphagnum troendelagicum]
MVSRMPWAMQLMLAMGERERVGDAVDSGDGGGTDNILVSPVTIPELGAYGYGKVKFVQAVQCSIPIRTAIFPV